MKRWQVIATSYALLGVTGPFTRVLGEYRWRWVAVLNAWMWNYCPPVAGVSTAEVRRKPPELKVVK